MQNYNIEMFLKKEIYSKQLSVQLQKQNVSFFDTNEKFILFAFFIQK